MPVIIAIVAVLGIGWYIATHVAAVSAVLIGTLAFIGAWYVIIPILCILVGLLAWMVDDRRDHYLGLPITMVAVFGLLQLTKRVDIVGFAQRETPMFLLYIVAYFAIGIAWSFFRVHLLAKDMADEHAAKKKAFMEANGNNEAAWLEQLSHYNRPRFDSHKGQILAWFAYWPFSMVWFAFHDLFRRLVDAIYDLLKNAYRKVFEQPLGATFADYEKAREHERQKMEERDRQQRSGIRA